MAKKIIEETPLVEELENIIKEEKSDDNATYEVYDKHNQFIQSYNFEKHGKEAKQCAENYAKKINGTITTK